MSIGGRFGKVFGGFLLAVGIKEIILVSKILFVCMLA